MNHPPKLPLVIDGKRRTYFQKLCLDVKNYLDEDGISLNFDGYADVREKYLALKEDESDKAWELTKELNGWAEYFSDIANLIQKQYLDSETEKIQAQAVASISHSAVKVSAGDRYADTDDRVIVKRKKRNALKALHEELKSKIQFLERAHYHCKSTCQTPQSYAQKNNQNND